MVLSFPDRMVSESTPSTKVSLLNFPETNNEKRVFSTDRSHLFPLWGTWLFSLCTMPVDGKEEAREKHLCTTPDGYLVLLNHVKCLKPQIHWKVGWCVPLLKKIMMQVNAMTATSGTVCSWTPFCRLFTHMWHQPCSIVSRSIQKTYHWSF